MDRIDLWLEVSKVDYEKLSEQRKESETEKIKERVVKARKFQQDRFEKLGLKNIKTNSRLSAKNLIEYLTIPEELQKKFNDIARKLDLSARSYHKVLKLSRTIGDLEESEEIKENHLLEALQYRPKKINDF